MALILLDQEGDAPLRDGFHLITSEVEFLQMATAGLDLHVRGESLCQWAETYYSNRRVPVRYVKSITREMQHTFPELDRGQIGNLLNRYGESIQGIDQPLTSEKILSAIFPIALWSSPYSPAQLAEWLVWVYEKHPAPEVQILMRSLTNQWSAALEEDILAIFQKSIDFEWAEEALDNWLGIQNREEFPLPDEFPLKIPNPLIQKARDKWNFQIVATHGRFFDQVEPLAIPFELKKIAAKETYQYFLQNSSDLSAVDITSLSRYLNYQETNELRKRLPPKPPKDLPDTPDQIAQWYLADYLPYREWQEGNAVVEAKDHVIRSANQFAHWYLDNYPRALSGAPLQKWLSFYRTSHLEQNDNVLTLIIVLDGMHSSDARALLQNIRTHTTRLSIVSEEVAFSPIPTITEFAKEALFRGVPPEKIKLIDPIGIILPEDTSPARRLMDPDLGRVYLWRVLEPDRTYHSKNYSENLRQDVAGRLEAEALKIKEIIDAIPNHIMLRIIITTDHGRLLGKSTRALPVPDGMQGHRRVSWGEIDQNEFGEGWFERDNIAFLSGERFGMSYDMAIPLGEEGFLGNDNRGGSESYPHGGLFPEEVIIPWIVFARDVVRPKVEITLTGDGKARGSGTLQFKVLNLSDIDVFFEEVILYFRDGSESRIALKSNLKPRHESLLEQLLSPWPSSSEAAAIRGIAKIVQPNGLSFDYSIVINLSSKDIYDRGENILEDLF